MTRTASFECDICGNEFSHQHEAEEHVVYNHNVVKDRINVIDEANQAEAGGL